MRRLSTDKTAMRRREGPTAGEPVGDMEETDESDL